jgi:ADP-heptose:LPS heptosyltransferase
MHDVEVAAAEQAGVGLEIDLIPASPERYVPNTPIQGSLIVPFIGSMGDALCMQPILETISRCHPHVEIDVATTPGPAEVFELFSNLRIVRPYPLGPDDWRGYDHFLSMEALQHSDRQPGRSLPCLFAQALGMTLDDPTIRLVLESARRLHPRLVPIDGPIVGLAMGGKTHRAYPPAMLRDLVDRLTETGVTCALLGLAEEGGFWVFPDEWVIDLRSQTESVPELAACLNRMDVIVAHDSFILHLAGALQRPTIGLFAPSSRHHAEHYPSVQSLASGAMCSPCHESGTSCPKSFPTCVAWEDPKLSPERIAMMALRILGLDDQAVDGFWTPIAV